MNEFIFGTLSTPEKRVEYLSQLGEGVCHNNNLSPRTPRPGEEPEITVTVALPFVIKQVICHVQVPEPQEFPLQAVAVEWDLINWRYVQVWQGKMPAFPSNTLVRYTIQAIPKNGTAPLPADDGSVFSYLVGDPTPPKWAAEAIIYQIMPDRFYPGDGQDWNAVSDVRDIYGGTLRGIIDKLDYIAGMGFNCLWLNPFFPDHTHHGYHATDYFSVNPRLGTMDDIEELVIEAHKRGLRLLLDFVANHWGSGHATFQTALTDPDSDYVNWYHWIDYPHEYHTFFGVKDLPKINVDYPAARAHLLKAVDFWLREIGFDGYRCDYVVGVPQDFWTDFRVTAKTAKADAWVFGEAVEHPSSQLNFEGRFDGNLDFMLLQALRDTLVYQKMDVAAFANFLDLHEAYFPATFNRPSFLDNHDMNRFLWLAGGDTRKLKLAALCQFTLAGPPIVYYGTEAGLSQERDVQHENTGRHVMEESRLPMVWGEQQNEDLQEFYRWLIAYRRGHPAVVYGKRQTVLADKETGLLAYTRSDKYESLLVMLNFSNAAVSGELLGYSYTLAPWTGDISKIN